MCWREVFFYGNLVEREFVFSDLIFDNWIGEKEEILFKGIYYLYISFDFLYMRKYFYGKILVGNINMFFFFRGF